MKRVKRRYLAMLVGCEAAVSRRDFLEAIWVAVRSLYGEFGASQTGLSLIDFNEEKKTAIIRVSLTMLQQVRASIASITRIQGKEVAVHVTAISGTLKSLQEK